jgi:stearoyl-CoA desaturase (delta-9 desaturase)
VTTTPTPIRAKRDYGTGIGLGFIHLCALAAFMPMFFSWSAVAVCLVLVYVTGGLGVTLGYHRLLTHRSFRMPKLMEYASAFFGTLALQGGPIWWVATHRKHHAHSDKDGDPHDVYKGWWWAHIDWLYRSNKDRPARNEVARYTKDMIDDKVYVFLNTFEVPIQIAVGLLLFAAGGISWVVWGVFVRLVLTYHITWLVNSAAHTSGYRTFRTTDRSMNNWMVALLAFGEGWHNNHHAFPFSARHGMKRSEFDMTWSTIKLLSGLRLAREVRVPTPEMLDRLRIDRVGDHLDQELSA